MRRRMFGSVIGQPASGGGTFPAAFSAWSARIKITILASQIGSDLTDFPVYVDLRTLPASFFTTVNSDGGDIRVTKADGETEVPREVVDIDVGGESGELHFLADGTLSSSTDTDFYIYYGNNAESDYAADATYGAEKVWKSFAFVSHSGGGQDSVSGITGSAFGSVVVGGAASPIGSATYYNGVDRMMAFEPTISLSGGSTCYVSMWLRPDQYQPNRIAGRFQNLKPFSWLDDVTNDQFSCSVTDVGTMHVLTTGGNTGPNSSGIDVTDNNFHLVYLLFDQGNDTVEIYVDDILDYSNYSYTDNSTIGLSTSRLYIGADINETKDGVGEQYAGRVAEVRIRKAPLSAGWRSAEYENQNSPNTFYSVGTPEIN